MRKVMLFIWLLLPVVAVAYHYGPGQDDLRADEAGDALERVEAAATEARAIAAARVTTPHDRRGRRSKQRARRRWSCCPTIASPKRECFVWSAQRR